VRPATDVLELLTVSRAEPGKAIDIVVDAVRSRPELRCRFTLVGDGPELEALRARAAGDTRFRFLGAIPSDRVLDLYAQADVFLFPSRYDVFGNVLVEAMGAGLAPVVASEPGAVADLCVDGRNAVIVRESTPAAWAEALDRVVTPGTAGRLGAAAADTIRRRWTMEHSVDAFVAGLRLGALVAGDRSRA
jgi:glycosyltransferase involved in cell wall biosynthesis